MKEIVDEIIEAYRKAKSIDKVQDIREFNTPGYTGEFLVKNQGETIMLDQFRSIVGKLLYYTTNISPDCANAVRELSQHMANPNESHWRSLGRVVGYLKQKKNHTLVYREPNSYRSVSYVDSNYATNTDNRRSVSGFVNTIGGMITNWTSKTQSTVSLSSAEAEYIALGMCAQETVFQNGLLLELGDCEKPGLIKEDNTGAIFLVKNRQVSPRTKHIDVRHHFIRDLHDDNELLVEFERGYSNVSDVLTKNVDEATFKRHMPSLLYGNLKKILSNCTRENVKQDASAASRKS